MEKQGERGTSEFDQRPEMRFLLWTVTYTCRILGNIMASVVVTKSIRLDHGGIHNSGAVGQRRVGDRPLHLNAASLDTSIALVSTITWQNRKIVDS